MKSRTLQARVASAAEFGERDPRAKQLAKKVPLDRSRSDDREGFLRPRSNASAYLRGDALFHRERRPLRGAAAAPMVSFETEQRVSLLAGKPRAETAGAQFVRNLLHSRLAGTERLLSRD